MLKCRREFLKDTALMGLAATAAGCQFERMFNHAGAPMAGFAAPPLRTVRIGFVGVGNRGMHAFTRLAQFPGVEIAACCDIDSARIAACRGYLKKTGLKPALEFLGPEAYRDLCQSDKVDVVYACTPWKLHEPVGIAAMEAGKHVMLEVPATMSVDGCWNLVETSERTRRHCMMLENCCYGEHELLALNMCRLGLLGEPVYAEAGYRHTLPVRGPKFSAFRAEWYQEHRGNFYPTHGLGPVAQYLNINRGDRFDYLNSMEGASVGDLIRGGDERWNGDHVGDCAKFLSGAHNNTLIRTANGRAIYLDLCIHASQPYSRLNSIQGTKGIFKDFPLRIDLEKTPGDGPRNHKVFDDAFTEECRQKYMHPLWKDVGELAKKIGGHGGMDFIMDLRWVYCLQNGLPLDMDVYDLASWSCLCELTERSQAKRGAPVEIPDFTRGAWKTMKPLGIETIDVSKLHLRDSSAIGPQQTI